MESRMRISALKIWDFVLFILEFLFILECIPFWYACLFFFFLNEFSILQVLIIKLRRVIYSYISSKHTIKVSAHSHRG